MASLNRTMILNTLIKHETLTIDNLAKMVNPNTISADNHLQFLLNELIESKHINRLNEVTYTITTKGISEGKRLTQEVQESNDSQPSWPRKTYN